MRFDDIWNWPKFTEEEAACVREVLLSNRVNYWTGEMCRQFEREFCEWSDTTHAISLMNGTVALELALRALEIGPGDEVIVTPRTFIASVSCVVSVGATPVFVDVDRDSQNITTDSIAAAITPRTRGIICVHLAGWPCEMRSTVALADQHGIAVIEDCAQAHGAAVDGQSVGSFGAIGAWSFCQDKIMTTGGEGGMVTTNDAELWRRMWSYKDHGKSWSAVYERAHSPGFRWVHESFGTNYRMTEMQAAIGRVQLRRMPDWHSVRLANAEAIWSFARTIDGLYAPQPQDGLEHAAYKCYVFLETEKLRAGWDRDRVVREINSSGVPCYTGSCSELYLEEAFDRTPWRPEQRLSVAQELGERSLMFLVHPTLPKHAIEQTCEVLEDVMMQARL